MRQKAAVGAAASLKATAQLLGLLHLDDEAMGGTGVRPSIAIDESKVEASIAARNAARKAKNFKESDRIRDELAAMGVVLKDNKDGTTTWEVATMNSVFVMPGLDAEGQSTTCLTRRTRGHAVRIAGSSPAMTECA